MYNFPFFPHFYSRPYYSYPQNAHPKNKSEYHNNRENSLHNNIMETSPDNKNPKDDDYNNNIIEILGIKLHQDDILLICLIFFLYQEGVKDEFLFIVLILLLLT